MSAHSDVAAVSDQDLPEFPDIGSGDVIVNSPFSEVENNNEFISQQSPPLSDYSSADQSHDSFIPLSCTPEILTNPNLDEQVTTSTPPENAPIKRVTSATIQSSAVDLGLDPDFVHVFVFSDAGKPIYSRCGDENKLAHVMGVMQALVSVVNQRGDQLQAVVAEDKHMVFRTFGHLVLVAVGSSHEPISHLTVILGYVHNQIVSALTQQRIDKWFMQKHNLDLRNLLIGDSRLLSGAIELVETQMGPTLNAVLCIPLPNVTRETVVQAITHGVKSQV
ncbi:unnamed protein product [Mesocestoides corti]|uniref:Vacuolar fusion protein MON1 homolog n=1 Tax=Mesocestoides corti TaxID=53468 RepID=A0A0R3UBN3_MESCO|nr:unnamed protein product [Mesocestoides corti]